MFNFWILVTNFITEILNSKDQKIFENPLPIFWIQIFKSIFHLSTSSQSVLFFFFKYQTSKQANIFSSMHVLVLIEFIKMILDFNI